MAEHEEAAAGLRAPVGDASLDAPAGDVSLDALWPVGPDAARGLVDIDGERWTWGALRIVAEARARSLQALGLRPGDRLALWAPVGADAVLTFLAAWRLGAAVLPLPPRAADLEAADLLGRAEVRLLLGTPELAARARAYGVVAVSFDALRRADGPLPSRDDTGGSAIAAIVPTSGTTGPPKLAMLTAAGLASSADATAQAMVIGPLDSYWLPLPLHHVGGLGALVRAIRTGATLALAPAASDPDVLGRLASLGITHASLVPTQLHDVLQHGATWPQALRAVMVGGAAPPPDLLTRCPAAWGTYGLTEAGGTVTLAPADGTSGLALSGWELRVLDPAGQPLPAGQEGSVALRGPGLMAGYYGDLAATEAALADGWLRTGDLGRLDAQGRLTILARGTDLIISGGENVYPAEVEAALRLHPAIADAAVVAAPDPRWGQVPQAFVVPRGAETPTLDELRTWLDGRLARFKHPRQLAWLPTLPRLSSGKVDRRALAGSAS